MAIGLVRVQYTLQGISALPRDRYVNTFYFSSAGSLDTGSGTSDVVDAADLVEGFYSFVVTATTKRVAEYLAQPAIAATGGSIKVYNMGDPEPRVPAINRALTLPGMVATAALPAEMAVCLSFQGARVSGQEQASRRGRIFIGPLNTAASDATASPHVSTALITTLQGAAKNLRVSAEAKGLQWCVYSPTKSVDLLTGYRTTVDETWVDNAFDVQRRRGAAATTRTTQTVP